MNIDKKKSFFEECDLDMSDEEIDMWCSAIQAQFEIEEIQERKDRKNGR